MDTSTARKYYEDYAPSIAYLEIEDRNGTVEIGTAYHIGEGIFVTARHVLDVPKILSIATTVSSFINNEDGSKTLDRLASELKIVDGPIFHPDENVDVACFIANRKDLPSVPLGTHLNDWIGDEMVLHSTLVLGYPPIPFSSKPELVATIAEINAVIDKYTGVHPQFILSCMARGGFSGGLSLNEYGFSMGVIVESLGRDNQPTELGYLSVISIEAIYTMLAHYKIMPDAIRQMWVNEDGTTIWDE